MSLFLANFQLQNVLNLVLFSMTYSHLLMAKLLLTLALYENPWLIGDIDYFND